MLDSVTHFGEFENEFKDGEYIKEIIVSGAKSYSFLTNKGRVVVKQKGITLNCVNSKIFTFENVKNVVLKNEILESEKRYQFVWNKTTKDVETRYISRKVQTTLDSKRMIKEGTYDTVPFGYVPRQRHGAQVKHLGCLTYIRNQRFLIQVPKFYFGTYES